MIRFISLSSGSCGNCYFLGLYDDADGSRKASLVVDCGVSLRRATRELARHGISLQETDCILVTHDHMDHIRSLGSWCKKLSKPVFATEPLHKALSHNPMTQYWISGCRRCLAEGEWNEAVPGRIRVRPFVVPHDASQTVGYAIELDGRRFVIMTDLGRITPEALELAREAETVVIESNYDPDMLENGPYPEILKARIRGGNGHLSNPECAEAIRSFDHEGLRNVFLCHLSDHNNTPELAYACSKDAARCRVAPLPRELPSPLFLL